MLNGPSSAAVKRRLPCRKRQAKACAYSRRRREAGQAGQQSARGAKGQRRACSRTSRHSHRCSGERWGPRETTPILPTVEREVRQNPSPHQTSRLQMSRTRDKQY